MSSGFTNSPRVGYGIDSFSALVRDLDLRIGYLEGAYVGWARANATTAVASFTALPGHPLAGDRAITVDNGNVYTAAGTPGVWALGGTVP